jgi:hypothetical protein
MPYLAIAFRCHYTLPMIRLSYIISYDILSLYDVSVGIAAHLICTNSLVTLIDSYFKCCPGTFHSLFYVTFSLVFHIRIP